MPINNQKGLEALRALSTGGTPALESYNQAKQAEQASRTTALQDALGGQDVSAAVAKAQAQYAPQVAGGTLGIDNLNVAADSYLSQAANKLSAQNYEDQQNLTLQAAKLRAKQNEMTTEERMNQLQGASEAWAAEQQGNVAADTQLGGQLGNLATRKAILRDQLTAFDQSNPDLLQGAQVTPEALAAREAQRGDILRQMAGLDQQYAASADQYAGLIGTDTKGLLDTYGQADMGNNAATQDLVGFLAPQAEAAAAQKSREIATGTQGRLRELAPAFGIDPLTAAGQFREGEGNDLKRQSAIAAEEDFVAGDTTTQRKAQDEEAASQLGFASGSDFSTFKKQADMKDEDIISTLQSSEWSALNDLTDSFIAGEAEFTVPGTDKKVSLEERTGKEGLNEAIRELVNNPDNPLVDAEGKPLTTAQRSKLVQLATRYFGSKAFGVEGKGEGTE